MAAPYLHERQTEYWTSRAVEDYFLDAGCEVLTFPLSQFSEHRLPIDFIFYAKKFGKLFGFQYKPLYHNGDDYWPVDPVQLHALEPLRGWAYYSLSELTSGREHRLALHKQIIIPPDAMPRSGHLARDDASSIRYFRWGGFARMLEECRAGRRVETEAELLAALQPLVGERDVELRTIVDVFIVGFEQRQVLHLAPDLSHYPPLGDERPPRREDAPHHGPGNRPHRSGR